MDADTLRIILVVLGALVLAGLFFWERRKYDRADEDAEYDDDDEAAREGKREPRLGPWKEGDDQAPPQAGGVGDQAASPRQPAAERDAVRTGGGGPAQQDSGIDLASALPKTPPPEFPPGPLFLVLHVVSKGEPFDGAAIVHAADRCGMDTGEMEIFHCTLGEGAARQTLFSMANMVKPGTFPFGAMAEFRSPGLTLFSRLDGTPDDPGRMEEMLGAAHSLADYLGGELCDEFRHPLVSSAEQRLRERVMAFVGIRLAVTQEP